MSEAEQQAVPFPGGMPMPGQQPTPEQIQELQRRITEDAQRAGMTVPEFIEHIKEQRMRMMQEAAQQQMAQQQGHGHEHDHDHEGHDHDHDHGHDHDHDHNGHSHSHPHQQQGQPQPITPGPPNPKAIALAKFLRGQDLKPRTVILNGERKDMFRGRFSLSSPIQSRLSNSGPFL